MRLNGSMLACCTGFLMAASTAAVATAHPAHDSVSESDAIALIHAECQDAEGTDRHDCDGSYACQGRTEHWQWGITCFDSCRDFAEDECDSASYYNEHGEREFDCEWDEHRDSCKKVEVAEDTDHPSAAERIEEVHAECRDAEGTDRHDCDGSYACQGRREHWEWGITCLDSCRDFSEDECDSASYYNEHGEKEYDCEWDERRDSCKKVEVADDTDRPTAEEKLDEVQTECQDTEGTDWYDCDGSYACQGRLRHWEWAITCLDSCRDFAEDECDSASYYNEHGEIEFDCEWDEHSDSCKMVEVADDTEHPTAEEKIDEVHAECQDAEGTDRHDCDGSYACQGRRGSWEWAITCLDSCRDFSEDECNSASYYNEHGEKEFDCEWDERHDSCSMVEMADDTDRPSTGEQIEEIHTECRTDEETDRHDCDGSYACQGRMGSWEWGITCLDSCRDFSEVECDGASYYNEHGDKEYDCEWDERRDSCKKVEVADDTDRPSAEEQIEGVHAQCRDDEGTDRHDCHRSYVCQGRMGRWEWGITCFNSCGDFSEEECDRASLYNEHGEIEHDCEWDERRESCELNRH